MPKLHELQTGIRLSVLGDSRPEILAAILDDGIDPARRLQIHRNNFRLSLTEALKANFPVVCRVVDERFFAYAADRFITAHPPTSPCLSEYGAALPEFLEQFEPAQSVPYVPDLARLEWAILESSRAEDRLPVDVAALHQVDITQYPNLVLELDPSIRLLRSVWPVATIWAVHQSEDEIRPIDLHSGGCRVRIRRSGDGVRVDEIAADQFAFLAALKSGHRLAHAGAVGLAADPFFDMALHLRRLFAEDAIVGFSVLSPQTRAELEP